MSALPPPGIPELYDSEKVLINQLKMTLQLNYGFKTASTVDEETTLKRKFSEEAIARCAELGFGASVEWEWEDEQTGARSPDVSDDPEDMNLYWNPRLIIHERFDKDFQYDHERQKHEVASGLLDGKKGYIREDGTWHEDPLKKNIF